MKLLRAQFENFRLLRDLELDFSTSSHQNLTVIRAENETGKTTILSALQWALYGDKALPKGGDDYRLHPLDWNTELQGEKVSIQVQVDFETTISEPRPRNKEPRQISEQYRIIRTTYETIKETTWNRDDSQAKLYKLTEEGTLEIQEPDSEIRDKLPIELREIFFTDGDRALSFIETTSSETTKREQVKKAIKSLLGLDIIDETQKHIKRVASGINSEAKEVLGSNENIEEITTELQNIERVIQELEEKKEDAETQFFNSDRERAEVEKRIYEALEKGDRESLKNDLQKTKSQRELSLKNLKDSQKEHSKLFEHISLGRELLSSNLSTAINKLDKMRDQGKFPSMAIPILKEQLQKENCICGESLNPDNDRGRRHREHIQSLIDKSIESDALKQKLTDLYYHCGWLRPNQDSDFSNWTEKYTRIMKRRDSSREQLEFHGRAMKSLEIKIDEIKENGLQELQETKRHLTELCRRLSESKGGIESKLKILINQQKRRTSDRDKILKEHKKGESILAKQKVTQDVINILASAYKYITNEELTKVAEKMNDIFLEMIVSDPDQDSIIQKADINKDFDILVYGSANRKLNPDIDLNGASRRALTLAFILALTQVSEAEAPNVIDTPLGMMSGLVKSSVLKSAIKESSQLILFLTRSEIEGCGEIIEKKAGKIITLTNSAHYPQMLVNDPKTEANEIIRCECTTYEGDCKICRRRTDIDIH